MADVATLTVKVDTRDIKKAKLALKDFTKSSVNVEKATESTAKSFGALAKSVAALGAVYLGSQGLMATVRLADKYSLLNAKLQLTSKTTEEFKYKYDALFKISQETGSSFEDNIANFSNLSLALKDANIPTGQLLQLFEDLNKSLVVAGASTAEASSFMLQFKQALGANRLAGDEFKAMLEANSYWASEFAKALGTDIKGLYEMKEAQLLTRDVVLEAHKKMSASIEENFGKLPLTIERATTMVKNAWADIVNETNTASGATNDVAEAIKNLATTITENKDGIIILFTEMIHGASWLLEAFGNIGQSIAGWKSVIDGQLNVFKFATMGAEELAEWLSIDRKRLAELEEEKEKLRKKQKDDLKEQRKWFGEKKLLTKEEKKEIVARIKAINEEITAIKNQTSHKDALLIRQDKEKKIISAITKETKKVTKATTDYKQIADDIEDPFDSETEAAIRRVEDAMMDAYNDIVDLDKAISDFFEDIDTASVTATKKMSEDWERFSKDTKEVFADVIGKGLRNEFDNIGDAWDALMDGMINKFITMAAEMAAENIFDAIFGSGGGGGGGSSSSSSSSSSSWGLGTILDGVVNWFSGSSSSGGSTSTEDSWLGSLFKSSGSSSSSSQSSGGSDWGSALAMAGAGAGLAALISKNSGSSSKATTSLATFNETLDQTTEKTATAVQEEIILNEARERGEAAATNSTSATEHDTSATEDHTGAIEAATEAKEKETEKTFDLTDSIIDGIAGLAEFTVTSTASTIATGLFGNALTALAMKTDVAKEATKSMSEAWGDFVQGAKDAVNNLQASFGFGSEPIKADKDTIDRVDQELSDFFDEIDAVSEGGNAGSGGLDDGGFEPGGVNDPGEGWFAMGGYHKGGWRVVGEKGPELEFTGPSRIFNNQDTRQMMKPKNVTVSMPIALGGQKITDLILSITDQHIVARDDRGIVGRVAFA